VKLPLDASSPDFNRLVRTLQWAWLGVAVCLVGGIIGWIIHLIRTSLTLGDTPSASVAISLVAIPIFITFMGVVLYVFHGIRNDGSNR
jgi:hypothetical protein